MSVLRRAEHTLNDNPGLWLVHEPRAPLRAVCDIVAVHGLSGGPASTWTHKESHFLWLRDCLPTLLEDIPNGTSVRIWTFGYNANVVFAPAVAGIAEFTQSLLGFVDEAGIGQNGRRVIWIAHSLGGVVVKSALIDAATRGSQHTWLLDATVGIVFLATPHQGSHIANKGTYVASIAKLTGAKFNTKTLNTLKKNSDELFDKADKFRGVCENIKICSFFETLPLGTFGGVIVERRSASIGIAAEELCPLNADHRTICKFINSADMNLKLVKNKIKQMVHIAITSQGGPVFPTLPIRQAPGGVGGVGFNFTNGAYPLTRRGPPQGYQPPIVSPYPEDGDLIDLSSDHEEYDSRPSTSYAQVPDSRPSTSTSYRSVNSQSPGGQYQPTSRYSPPPATGQREPSPPNRGRAVSNEGQPRFTQTARPYQDHNRTQSTGFLNPGNQPTQQSRVANTGAARTPNLRPRPSGYSLNREQLAENNRQTSPLIPAKEPVRPPSPPKPDPLEEAGSEAYKCDVCDRTFKSKTARFRCTVCDDYDLCPNCYQKDSASKGHNGSHKMQSIAKREEYTWNDITPAIVIPQETAPRELPNWSVDADERRWLHLRTSPDHERYIVHGIAKGAYLVEVTMTFKFSGHVTLATLNELKKPGETIGEMTCVAGAPKDTSVFFSDPKLGISAENMSSELFASGRKFTAQLEVPAEITSPDQAWVKTWDFSATPILLGKDIQASKSATLALMLQWSDVRKFESNDNPVLLCTVDAIRMDELLVYDEPPAAPTPAPAPAPARTPATAIADDSEEGVTFEELIDAAKILIENGKAVTSENLLTIVIATREVQTENAKALLFRHIQQLQLQKRAEEEQRQRIAAQRQRAAQAQAQQAQVAGELLLLSWLLTQ